MSCFPFRMTNARLLLSLAAGLPWVAVCQPADAQPQTTEILTVDGDGTPQVEDGLSWGTAFRFLQDAIAEAVALLGGQDPPDVVQIWVAATDPANPYRPDRDASNPGGTGVRLETFSLHNRIELYGGFLGLDHPSPELPDGETELTQREPDANETVLSGEIGGPGTLDNSFHVVSAIEVDKTARLDGFTISAGRADGAFNDAAGGGMFIINIDGPPGAGPLVARLWPAAPSAATLRQMREAPCSSFSFSPTPS
jgi:hypothetical protein